jgi:hypothetical protein
METLVSMAELLARKCPAPCMTAPVLSEELATFNYELGRRSVVEELLIEKRRRENEAKRGAKA